MLSFLVSGLPLDAKDRQRLPIDQVRAVFVDKVWSNGKGEFLFGSDGIYSYFNCQNGKGTGLIRYDLSSSGQVVADYTNYTFFPARRGYEYHHSRSGRFIKATPSSKRQIDCASTKRSRNANRMRGMTQLRKAEIQAQILGRVVQADGSEVLLSKNGGLTIFECKRNDRFKGKFRLDGRGNAQSSLGTISFLQRRGQMYMFNTRTYLLSKVNVSGKTALDCAP